MAFRSLGANQPPTRPICTALVLIDQRPLQREAWAEFRRAQKLQDKAARDLHRHETTDTPAFVRWLHASFPAMVSEARELSARVEALSLEVRQVHHQALVTGRSPRSLWQEYKDFKADPDAFARRQTEERSKARAVSQAQTEDDHEAKAFFDDLFGQNDQAGFGTGPEVDSESADADHGGFDFSRLFTPQKPDTADARDIYRRLVQFLHPDRGGEWTPLRERVWHEVQQAWTARDADWLARLEIEWETAHDVLNEQSTLSRLRRAIGELRAARRDVERKLREYRKNSCWRFTLTEKKRPQLHKRTEAELVHDIELLRRELSYLENTIAGWELPLRPVQGARKGRRHHKRDRRAG